MNRSSNILTNFAFNPSEVSEHRCGSQLALLYVQFKNFALLITHIPYKINLSLSLSL